MSTGKGVAVIGASESNFWTGHAFHNLEVYGYEGEVWPVNPNYATVGGRTSYPTLLEIPGELEAVIVATGAQRCPDIVRQAVRRNVKDIVIVADGFAERDPNGPGALLQKEMVSACTPQTRLYGPNCVGFADFRRNLCAIAEPIPENAVTGDISIVSQSGAAVSSLMASVVEDGGGFDWCVSLGNAAQFDVSRAIEYACERGTTRVLAMYIETLGTDGPRLRSALARAQRDNVRIVMLKVGRTSRSARIALSHTASVAGDDAQVDALLRAYGVLRVESYDELARVAVLARLDQRRSGAPAVVFIGSSGGQAAVASDLAARDGLELAELEDSTKSIVRESVAPGSFTENPLDLVGRPGGKSSLDEAFQAVFRDPTVGLAVSPWSVLFPDDSPGKAAHRESISLAVETGRKTGTPTVIVSAATVPWTDWTLQLRQDNPDIAVLRGLENTVRALSRLYPETSSQITESSHAAPASTEVVGEIEGRRLLDELEVPVIQGTVCTNADEAADACADLSFPVVVKLDIAGASHKAKVGGVVLNLRTAGEVRDAVKSAYAKLAENGIESDRVLGILVEEQAEGDEVLVGLSRSELGAFLTIGRGGVRAGAGTPAETMVLPVDDKNIERALRKFAPVAGAESLGLAAAVGTVQQLSVAFESGALSEYGTVEVNPLFVSNDRAAIVDVLLVRQS